MDEREQLKRWVNDILASFGRPLSGVQWINHEGGSATLSIITDESDKTFSFDRSMIKAIVDGDAGLRKKVYDALLDLVRR